MAASPSLLAFLAATLLLALAGAARADVPVMPGEGGDCEGDLHLICHRSVGGQQVTGICYSTRQGTVCGVDDDSRKRAAAIQVSRAERSVKETTAVAIVAAVCGLLLAGVIVIARRRRRREPLP